MYKPNILVYRYVYTMDMYAQMVLFIKLLYELIYPATRHNYWQQ